MVEIVDRTEDYRTKWGAILNGAQTELVGLEVRVKELSAVALLAKAELDKLPDVVVEPSAQSSE